MCILEIHQGFEIVSKGFKTKLIGKLNSIYLNKSQRKKWKESVYTEMNETTYTCT